MPRYLVERTFPNGLEIPMNKAGKETVQGVVNNNDTEHVTWLHSYVTEDRKNTVCVYDGPNPEAIKRVAEKNGLPVDRITKVFVLDPYFYS